MNVLYIGYPCAITASAANYESAMTAMLSNNCPACIHRRSSSSNRNAAISIMHSLGVGLLSLGLASLGLAWAGSAWWVS